jgi:hypothetical protein
MNGVWLARAPESGLRMGGMNELIAAATLIVIAAGLWFAYSYNRQMALKLSETHLKAYSRLWQL